MARALFCLLADAALPEIIRELQTCGVRPENISTLTFPPRGEYRATGQLKWAMQGFSGPAAARRVGRVLAGMGMPESAARHYQELIRGGETLMCVFCEEPAESKQAQSVLQNCGARELAATGSPTPEARALSR
jgi:hypothetical protein